MVKTIQAALSPLLTIGSICSLAIFEYPIGRPRPYLSCLYFSITWSLFIFIFYYFFYSKYALVMSWPSMVIMFASLASMCDSIFRSKELYRCLHKLSIVDDTLEVLGMPKQYQLLHKCIIRWIIAWAVLSCLLNILDSFWVYFLSFDIVRICIPFFGNHLIHVNTYNGLIWGITLRYTGSRFQHLNEYIYKLLGDDTKCTKKLEKDILINQQRAKIKDTSRCMWILMHVHLHLSQISHQLNKIFSMQMTLQMASYFAFFVDILCLMYTSYLDRNNSIGKILDGLSGYIWLVVCFVKLVALNYICQTVSDKAKETIIILYKLCNNCTDENLREQILQFILQIKQREVTFSGMGLFYFGYGFIRHFCKSIVTILIIIIQMRVSYSEILQSVNDEDYITL